MNKVRQLLELVRSSLWFVPTLAVLGGIALAFGLIAAESAVDRKMLIEHWPLLFGAGAEGSRGMLAVIASSMITVAGVAFSITIVALALASSQYTSRILRNFMRDRANQSVLGVFMGIFAYCLIVLRSIRGGDEGVFVPSLAVLGGVVLAFVGVGFLIFFVHHIAASIQASNIIKAVTDETLATVDRLFLAELGEPGGADGGSELPSPSSQTWFAIPAEITGYLQSIDAKKLLRFAEQNDSMVRMERGIGDFVVEGSPLVSLAGSKPDDATVCELNAVYTLGRQRTITQDVAFGIRQIVDVALKALSPGINDTTTAIICIDYLGAILVRVASRRIASTSRSADGELRVIARGPNFADLLADAFDQIRQNAESNTAVLTRLLDTLSIIAGRTTDVPRRQALLNQADLITEAAGRGIRCPYDCKGVQAARDKFAAVLIEGRKDGLAHR